MVQVPDACRILGLDEVTALDARAVRAAYRSRIRRMHPDVSTHPDAADRTASLTQAYELLTAVLATRSITPAGTGAPERRATEPSHAPPPVPRPAVRAHEAPATVPEVRLLADGSISVAAPAEETLMLILDTAHSLGEISYLDPSAGLVEVVVEFVEAPTSSVLFSFQGRGDGTTEVFCTVEPLSGGMAPPADAVTRLVVETLRGEPT